jgi:NAD dependent epimerase/dehydratase family
VTLALVTGGAGFIGSQVVAALTERGWDVRILDSAADKAWRVQDSAGEKAHRIPASVDGKTYCVELIQGDIRDRAACDRALAGVTLVLHQAAKVGLGVDVRAFPDYTDVNATGTATLLTAMVQQASAPSCSPPPWSCTARAPPPVPSTAQWPPTVAGGGAGSKPLRPDLLGLMRLRPDRTQQEVPRT